MSTPPGVQRSETDRSRSCCAQVSSLSRLSPCALRWLHRILQSDRPEKQKAESPLVALTLPLAATRPSLSPLGPEPLKDPWLSAPRSRGVWFSQLLRDRPGKGPCLNELVRGLLSWHCMRRCG